MLTPSWCVSRVFSFDPVNPLPIPMPGQVHALERVYGKTPPPPASSELRPVALTRSADGQPRFTMPVTPMPMLKRTFLEWAVLNTDWQQGAVGCGVL